MALTQDDFRNLIKKGSRSEETASKADAGDVGEGDGRPLQKKGQFGGKRQLTQEDLAFVSREQQREKQLKKTRKDDTQNKQQKTVVYRKGKRIEIIKNKTQGDEKDKKLHDEYRDRAAERRTGFSLDYRDEGLVNVHNVDADTSKFLGGDMEHTHLVKGLDFALLSRLKTEEQQLSAQAKALSEVKKEYNIELNGVEKQGKMSPQITSRLGKTIIHLTCGASKAMTHTEMFLPGRTCYEFNTTSDEFDDIPTKVQRSKGECPDPDDYIVGSLPAELMNTISEIGKTAGLSKRRRKKEKYEQKIVSVETNKVDKVALIPVEEDIFPDAGEYVPPGSEAVISNKQSSASLSGGYFANLSTKSTAEAENEKVLHQMEAEEWETFKKKFRKQPLPHSTDADIETDVIDEKLGASDHYDECYPAYQVSSMGAAYDSDDDTTKKNKDETSSSFSSEKKRFLGKDKKTNLDSDLTKSSKGSDVQATK